MHQFFGEIPQNKGDIGEKLKVTWNSYFSTSHIRVAMPQVDSEFPMGKIADSERQIAI